MSRHSWDSSKQPFKTDPHKYQFVPSVQRSRTSATLRPISSKLEEAGAKLTWPPREIPEKPSWCRRHYSKPWVPVEPVTMYNCWGRLNTPLVVGARIFASRAYVLYDIATDVLVVLDLVGNQERRWMIIVSIALMVLPVLVKMFVFRYLTIKLLTGEWERGGWGLSKCTAYVLYILFSFFAYALIELYLFIFYPWKKPNHMILTPVDRLAPFLETMFEATPQMLFQCWIYYHLNQKYHVITDSGINQNSVVLTNRELADSTLMWMLVLSIVPSIFSVIYRIIKLRMEAHDIGMTLRQMLWALLEAPLGISAPFLDLLADKTVDSIDFTGVGPLNQEQQRQIFHALATKDVTQAIEFDDTNKLNLKENAVIFEQVEGEGTSFLRTPISIRSAKFGYRHSLEDAYAMIKGLNADSVEIGLICLDGDKIQEWLEAVSPSMMAADEILNGQDGIAGRVVEGRRVVTELREHLEGSGLRGGCQKWEELRRRLMPALNAQQRLETASYDVCQSALETMSFSELKKFIEEVGGEFNEAMNEASTLGLDEDLVIQCKAIDAEIKLELYRERLHALTEVSKAAEALCDDYRKMSRQSKKLQSTRAGAERKASVTNIMAEVRLRAEESKDKQTSKDSKSQTDVSNNAIPHSERSEVFSYENQAASQVAMDNFLAESRKKLKVVLSEAVGLGIQDSCIMGLDEMKQATQILEKAAQFAQEKQEITYRTWQAVVGIKAEARRSGRSGSLKLSMAKTSELERHGKELQSALEKAKEKETDVCEGLDSAKEELNEALEILRTSSALATNAELCASVITSPFASLPKLPCGP